MKDSSASVRWPLCYSDQLTEGVFVDDISIPYRDHYWPGRRGNQGGVRLIWSLR